MEAYPSRRNSVRDSDSSVAKRGFAFHALLLRARVTFLLLGCIGFPDIMNSQGDFPAATWRDSTRLCLEQLLMQSLLLELVSTFRLTSDILLPLMKTRNPNPESDTRNMVPVSWHNCLCSSSVAGEEVCASLS